MSSISKVITKEKKTPYDVEKIAQILDNGFENPFSIFEYERPSLCDDDIKEFKNPIEKLEDILNYQWEQTDSTVNEKLNFESSSFSSKEGINLIAVKNLNRDSLDEGQALLVLRPKDYIFIACTGGHPCIETPFFEYFNSDGSGPILFDTEDIKKPKTLAKHMVKYYGRFLEDYYH